MFVVTVFFNIKPDAFAQFMPLMQKQAENSLAQEPDCHTFDVCHSPDGPQVFLYEVYTDRAAFDLHLASAHFKSFDTATAPLIADKQVQIFHR